MYWLHIASCSLTIIDKYATPQIKLADKQAALEKTQWEAMTSKQKVEKLQNDIDSMQGEFSSFMLLLNGLTKNNASTHAEDYDITPYHLDHLPYIVSLLVCLISIFIFLFLFKFPSFNW